MLAAAFSPFQLFLFHLSLVVKCLQICKTLSTILWRIYAIYNQNCFQIPRLPAPSSSTLQQSYGRDLVLDSQADKTIVRPHSLECKGKFQDLLLGAFSLMLELLCVAAITTLSNPHVTSRMLFPTLLGRGYLMDKWCFVSTKHVDAWEVKKNWDEVTLRGTQAVLIHPQR